MLMDLLNKVATTVLLGFVVSSMMTMGLGFTVRQIIDALGDVRLVLLALVANFVAMPLGALALDKLLRLDEPLGVGLLLLGEVLIALGFGIGWMLGGLGLDTRRALALGTAQRNIAAALVVASESFSDPSVVIMVIVVMIVGLLTLMPLCHALANYGFERSRGLD